MAFSVSIAVIVFTFIHCTGPPSIYSSSTVDSFIASPYHRLPAPLKRIVRVSSPEKTPNSTSNSRNGQDTEWIKG
jgi:hypothetical protein